jgi:hypothetical protein
MATAPEAASASIRSSVLASDESSSKNKYGLGKAFDLLTPICAPECFGKDPRRLGIIRDT